MLRLLPLLIMTLAASPALAGATPWQDLAPGVKARLISSDSLSNGTTLVGLQIDMPANTKTYWRIPGESGIPTQLDFGQSEGVGAPQIDWPYPQIEDTQGYRDYVYHGPLVLPVRLPAAGSSASLDLAITLGICSDICVPAQAKFALPVSFGTPDAEQSIRLTQAETQVPIPWDQPQSPFGAVTATSDGLAISDLDPAIDPQSLIADIGDPSLLFGTPQKSPDGHLSTLKQLGGAAGSGLAGRPVQFSFTTAMGPYTASATIAAPAP